MCLLCFDRRNNILNFGYVVFRQAKMISEIASEKSTKLDRQNGEVTLTAGDAQKLIGLCVELLDLCSKVIGQIDPAVGKLIAFAHDEALTSIH